MLKQAGSKETLLDNFFNNNELLKITRSLLIKDQFKYKKISSDNLIKTD